MRNFQTVISNFVQSLSIFTAAEKCLSETHIARAINIKNYFWNSAFVCHLKFNLFYQTLEISSRFCKSKRCQFFNTRPDFLGFFILQDHMILRSLLPYSANLQLI